MRAARIAVCLLLIPIVGQAQLPSTDTALVRRTGPVSAPTAIMVQQHLPNSATDIARLSVPDELRAMSPYAGWGAAIGATVGATAGVVRAFAREDSPVLESLDVVTYTVAGMVIGLTAGAATYLARRASGWLPG